VRLGAKKDNQILICYCIILQILVDDLLYYDHSLINNSSPEQTGFCALLQGLIRRPL